MSNYLKLLLTYSFLDAVLNWINVHCLITVY